MQAKLLPLYLMQARLRRQFECPTHQGEIYKLPTAVQEQVNMLYQRDIARMAGEGKDTKGMEDEYKTFLAELGGKDPRDLAGSGEHSGSLLAAVMWFALVCCWWHW